MVVDVIVEVEKIVNVRSCMFFRYERNICYVEGGRGKVEEKLDVEDVVYLREVDICVFLLLSGMLGLIYKYFSCESVIDEYVGYVI